MRLDKAPRCNWCGQNKELILGKKFCTRCSEGGRECRWCHRPLPERFYDNSSQKVCAACQRKHRNYQEKKKKVLRLIIKAQKGYIPSRFSKLSVTTLQDFINVENLPGTSARMR